MKNNTIAKVLAASTVALSLSVLPALAQTGTGTTGTGTDSTGTTGTTTTTQNYDHGDEGRNGYWGLMGLLGLLGRRSKQDDVATTYRDPSATEAPGARRY